jgi:hypothetical protein
VTNSSDAYSLAAVALAVSGGTVEGAYQQLPNLRPRTVRYILASPNAGLMYTSSVSELQEHKGASGEVELGKLRDLAETVKVAPGVAESAVTRYGNALDRVTRVLADLQTLQRENCRVTNPTGLFVRLMRSGRDVLLPERVVQARKAVEEKHQEEAAKPVPVLGALVRYCGEVGRIVELMRQFVVVEMEYGLVNVSRDGLRLIPS